jgi:uncharacterized UBP type Zn finger protein
MCNFQSKNIERELFSIKLFCDADINDPISKDSRAYEPSVDEASVQTLISFGFQEDIAIKALKASVRFPFVMCSA